MEKHELINKKKQELSIDGLNLGFLDDSDQTFELCLISIKQNPLAVQYVANQYLHKDLLIEAVSKNPLTFFFIKDKAEEFLSLEDISIIAEHALNAISKHNMFEKILDIYSDLDSKHFFLENQDDLFYFLVDLENMGVSDDYTVFAKKAIKNKLNPQPFNKFISNSINYHKNSFFS